MKVGVICCPPADGCAEAETQRADGNALAEGNGSGFDGAPVGVGTGDVRHFGLNRRRVHMRENCFCAAQAQRDLAVPMLKVGQDVARRQCRRHMFGFMDGILPIL